MVTAVARLHRLMSMLRIEDRETPHAERRSPERFDARVVGSAMSHGRAHLLNRSRASLARNGITDDSGYAAHRR